MHNSEGRRRQVARVTLTYGLVWLNDRGIHSARRQRLRTKRRLQLHRHIHDIRPAPETRPGSVQHAARTTKSSCGQHAHDAVRERERHAVVPRQLGCEHARVRRECLLAGVDVDHDSAARVTKARGRWLRNERHYAHTHGSNKSCAAAHDAIAASHSLGAQLASVLGVEKVRGAQHHHRDEVRGVIWRLNGCSHLMVQDLAITRHTAHERVDVRLHRSDGWTRNEAGAVGKT
jgi:hypothetical protein